MDAFHFGDSDRLLYGVYHAPRARRASAPAVLLCNPLGEEAVRAHRPFRLLAERLADAGAPVLRFDYWGAGDSAGDCESLTFGGMARDISTAHEELLDMSGAGRAVWTGLRLGATAALHAAMATKTRRPVGLVLWDPVVDGAAYLRELEAAHRDFLMEAGLRAADLERVDAGATAPAEALGFAVSPGFSAELAALSFECVPRRFVRRALVVSPVVLSGARNNSLQRLLADAGVDADWREAPDGGGWNSDRAMNAYYTPVRTLDLIVEEASNWR